ncbi:hypothetical protein FB459_2391 [Yimella lutea]|uniref:Nucleoside 2-deoxyribosyltransferase-like protein n=1 Tax=Yimella lutea TaxID=587872 RepID=A0A542EHR6_9MICO|nr:hypothetical protein [Yimella lutea]TQJ14875.1 hypothetical protein FB459_2391 [Yimella lutea]
MKIYIAAPLAAAPVVQQTRDLLIAAGHEITYDWTRDMSFVEGFATDPEKSAQLATMMISAVLRADAVVVLATEHDGRGMFVELGVALAQAEGGRVCSVAVVGPIRHESVFFHHPLAQRYERVDEWLLDLATT